MRYGKPQEDCRQMKEKYRSASSASAQSPATQQKPFAPETAVSKLIRETMVGEKRESVIP
jgi:hypothetical protein